MANIAKYQQYHGGHDDTVTLAWAQSTAASTYSLTELLAQLQTPGLGPISNPYPFRVPP